MQEVSLGGVYLPAALVWAGIAFFFSTAISWTLSRIGFYALIWHRALFDVSLFVTLWGAASAVAYHTSFGGGPVGVR
jgi:hypothetical protein